MEANLPANVPKGEGVTVGVGVLVGVGVGSGDTDTEGVTLGVTLGVGEGLGHVKGPVITSQLPPLSPYVQYWPIVPVVYTYQGPEPVNSPSSTTFVNPEFVYNLHPDTKDVAHELFK